MSEIHTATEELVQTLINIVGLGFGLVLGWCLAVLLRRR